MERMKLVKILKDELKSLQEADCIQEGALFSQKDDSADVLDLSQEQSSHNVVSLLAFKNQKRRKEIEQALFKIEHNPDFGSCEECGDEIPEKRLLVMPTASCCVKCQQKSEVVNFTYKKAQ